MTLIRDLSVMYAIFFTLPMFMCLFESRYSPRKTCGLLLGFGSVLLAVMVVMLFRLGVQRMSTLVLFTCSLPSMVFFWFLARYRDGRYFFTFCLADTLILWVICLTSLLDFYLGNTYGVMAVSRLILCPLLTFAVYRWVRPGYHEVQNGVTKGWGAFAAVSLIFYLELTLAFSRPSMITERPDELPAFMLLMLLMPVLYLFILRNLHAQIKAYETAEKESILEVQAANMQARIEEYAAAVQKYREERHNHRHQLQAIAALAQMGEYCELQSAIENYTQAIPEMEVRSYCQHPVIDAVLASYLHKAERNGVRISTKLDFPEKLPVSETELATMFANAIENATHSCGHVEPSGRFIDIQVLSTPCFMLQISNSYAGKISFDQQGIPVAPQPGHGYGTRSIVTFCDKNDAFYEFKADGSMFRVCIVFQ